MTSGAGNPHTASIDVGDAVVTTDNLNVRVGPGTDQPEITDPDYPGYAPAGTRGTVLAGPADASGYVWWEVNYGPGLYSGWSVADWLEELAGDVQGIDVSHWQGNIRWPEVRGAGYDFAFCKATEGIGWTDVNFEANMDNGHAAGVLMGPYHFGRPDLNPDAAAEAAYFVAEAAAYLQAGYLRPVLDLERGAGFGRDQLSNWVHQWMSTVTAQTGIEPIIYVNSNYANNYLNPSVAEYDLWIAHWTHDPSASPNIGIWDTWEFWQYTDNGSVAGISGRVDLDVFHGDATRLQEFRISELSIDNVQLTEGDSGTKDFRFTVSLSSASSRAVTVDYQTAGGTATAGSDFLARAGTLTIPAGQTGGTISVPVIGDTTVEPDETFYVELRDPRGATIADARGRATISKR